MFLLNLHMQEKFVILEGYFFFIPFRKPLKPRQGFLGLHLLVWVGETYMFVYDFR